MPTSGSAKSGETKKWEKSSTSSNKKTSASKCRSQREIFVKKTIYDIAKEEVILHIICWFNVEILSMCNVSHQELFITINEPVEYIRIRQQETPPKTDQHQTETIASEDQSVYSEFFEENPGLFTCGHIGQNVDIW